MSTTLESAFEAVKKLATDFENKKDYYLSTGYPESRARTDFIDKFFIALGWDVTHETQKNPYEQEVIIEQNLDVKGRKKRADYAFCIAPNFRDVVFFAEAKKPSVQIENEDDYFQAIRYGYSGKTPIVILTDFEQFHILDSRYTPSIDTALDRYVKRYTYKDYLDKNKFAEIYYLFSREAVSNGSIEKRALELSKVRGGVAPQGLFKGAYKPIDETLLDELDKYRDRLAHAFKNGNPDLDHWALTEIVQRTIDRLVFIRFLEDKLIEPEELISTFGENSKSAWKDFVSTCRKLDKIYNGTIYKKHDILDAPDFVIDENVFAEICEELSNKNTPYDFNSVPIHILGSIYERFLGKVITTTAKRAKVEDKPEVKKAGGVFYTPEYIVRYIVENTIGKLIEGKTPAEISKMRFADIACGSGSFLLGAYDCLLRYHVTYYNKNHKEASVLDCIERDGAYYLTLHKKREILVNNIYGVDIDQQAVEVAQLSLYLKLLENETLGTTAMARKIDSGETVLPYMRGNIQCGNSLVETDFEEGQQTSLFDKEYERTVNMFNWKDNFPEVMKAGGFDAVIGNPPYVRQEMLGEFKEYYKEHFKVFQGTADLYTYFFERGVNLLNKNGLFSIIVANKWMRANYGEPLRRWLKERAIYEIVDFGDLQVFQNATTYPCIITISKNQPNKNIDVCKMENLDFADLKVYVQKNKFTTNVASLKDAGWSLVNNKSETLLCKLISSSLTLKQYLGGNVFRGISTGLDNAFIIDEKVKNELIDRDIKNQEIIKPYLMGRDIKRYQINDCKRYILFTRRGVQIERYPMIEKYLCQFKESLTPKKERNIKGRGRKPGTYKWYEIQDSIDYYLRFDEPKIVFLKFQVKPAFAYDEKGFYPNSAIWVLPTKDLYLLGILNSKLGWFLLSNYCTKIQNGYQLIFKYLGNIPIKQCKKETHHEDILHDEIVSIVTSLFTLQKQLSLAKSDFDKSSLSRRIATTDRQIDELVYELYGLTEDEIKIVEESGSKAKNERNMGAKHSKSFPLN